MGKTIFFLFTLFSLIVTQFDFTFNPTNYQWQPIDTIKVSNGFNEIISFNWFSTANLIFTYNNSITVSRGATYAPAAGPSVAVSFTAGANGTVPSSSTPVSFNVACLKAATYRIRNQIRITNSSNSFQDFFFTFEKVCPAFFNFNLRLSSDQLRLVESGVVNFFVNNPQAPKSLPVPGDIDSIAMTWNVNIPNVRFNFTSVISLNGKPTPANNEVTVDLANNTGVVPTNTEEFTFIMRCNGDGKFDIANTVSLFDNSTGRSESYTFYFTKSCTSNKDQCAVCGPCYLAKTCNCTIGRSEGVMCNRVSTVTVSAEDLSKFTTFVYNTALIGTFESIANMRIRAKKISSIILEADYTFVLLQEVWNDDVRDVFSFELKDKYPFITLKTFGKGPQRESGLFFASKYPIALQDFVEFGATEAGTSDALVDKGVYGAMVVVNSNLNLFLFNTHLQAGGLKAVQTSQVSTVIDFIKKNLQSAIDAGYSISSTSVIFGGDFNVNAYGPTSSNVLSYEGMMDILEKPDDIFKKFGKEATEPPTESFYCSQTFAIQFNCTVNETIPLRRRVDYLFSYNNATIKKSVADGAVEYELLPLSVLSSTYLPFPDTTNVTGGIFRGFLSDHPAFTVEFEIAVDIVPIVVPIVVAAVVLAIVIFCLIYFLALKKPVPKVLKPNWLITFLRQSKALFYKNWLVNIRNRRAFIIQLIVPFLFTLALFGLQFALASNERGKRFYQPINDITAVEIPALAKCKTRYTETCYSLGYSPKGDAFVERVIDQMIADNNLTRADVIGFSSQTEANTYLFANRNSTAGVIHFNISYVAATTTTTTVPTTTTTTTTTAATSVPTTTETTTTTTTTVPTTTTTTTTETTTNTATTDTTTTNTATTDTTTTNTPTTTTETTTVPTTTTTTTVPTTTTTTIPTTTSTSPTTISSTTTNIVSGQPTKVSYFIQYNKTEVTFRNIRNDPVFDYEVPFQYAVESAILKQFGANPTTLNVKIADFPRPALLTLNVFQSSAPNFFLGALMFNVVNQCGNLVMEKELKLRQAMAVVGTGDVVYWFTWLVTNLTWNIVSAFLIIISGLIFQFKFFLLNDFATYFVTFVLFSISMVPIATLISVFLSKSRTATTFGFALYLVAIIAQGAGSQLFNDSVAEWIQVILKLFPFIIFAKSLTDLGNFSSSDSAVGMRWKDIYNYTNDFPLGEQFEWMIIDFFIFLGLTLILDFLIGGVYGETRISRFISWIFAGGKSKKTADIELEDVRDDDVIREEALVKDGKIPEDSILVLESLEKTFRAFRGGIIPNSKRNFTAVNNIYLAARGGQLLCLLGHNGAGKSTTISMLTGLVEPTFGDAKIVGLSLKKDIDKIRTKIGVCPQFDILWNELTGAEHIDLFSQLKGLDAKTIASEIDSRLNDVDLMYARNMWAGNYSGGMKRRLSVAISLCGNPQIVYLDEPTTGMDPVSRRQVWNLLEREKKNRLVVLTTHSMEEADMLGDNIVIMKHGQFRCMGTNIHLKSKYGDGYRMNILSADNEVTRNTVKELLPAAQEIRDPTPGTLYYNIPFEQVDELSTFLKAIEKRQEECHIEDIQIGMTSLEDVFLKIAGLESELDDLEIEVLKENELKEKNKNKKSSKKEKKEVAPGSNLDFKSTSQFKALLAKSAVLQGRQKRTNACQIFFPVAMFILLFLAQILINNIITSNLGTTSPANLQPKPLQSTLQVTADFNAFYDCPTLDQKLFAADPAAYLASLQTQDDYLSGRILTNTPNSFKPILGNYGPQVGGNDWWSGTTLQGNQIPSGILGNVSKNVLEFTGFKAKNYVQFIGPCFTKPYIFPITFLEKASVGEIRDTLLKAYSTENYLNAYIFDETSSANRLSYTLVYNKTITQGKDITKMINLLSTAVAKTRGAPEIAFTGTSGYPTPESEISLDFVSILGAFIFIYVYQLILPVFLSSLVYEKEFKLREIMKMMGLKTSVYWAVNYIVFFIFFMIASLLSYVFGLILGFKVFLNINFGIWLLTYIFWGNTMIAMAFFLQVFFSKSKTANVTGYIIVFVMGILCNFLVRNYFTDKDASYAIVFLFSFIVPQFNLFRNLIVFFENVSFGGPGLSFSDLSDTAGVPLIEIWGFFCIQALVFFALALYFEQVNPSGVGVARSPLFFLKKDFWVKSKETAESSLVPVAPTVEEPKDVAEERARVWDTEKSKDFLIKIMDLRKVYETGSTKKVAVDNFSMGIDNNTCFGLLGPNGSGKSTTINMLCGYFGPTSGTAVVNGFDIRKDIDKIHLLSGVCPQDNVIWEDLTALEHVKFYGRIKNLEGEALEEECRFRLKQVNLFKVRDKKAGQFSGGMKRRLCVAISLVGNPKIVLLDEPTTGLDPKARNNLWSVIRKAKEKSTILLTTHSMEEAEALTERIGIFVNGHLQTIGTSAALKSKFGVTFRLNVLVNPDIETEAKEFVSSKVSRHAILFNNPTKGNLIYKINKSDVTLAHVFEQFSKFSKKHQTDLYDWAISNSTLEEIFLQISLAELEKDTSRKQDIKIAVDEDHLLETEKEKGKGKGKVEEVVEESESESESESDSESESSDDEEKEKIEKEKEEKAARKQLRKEKREKKEKKKEKKEKKAKKEKSTESE